MGCTALVFLVLSVTQLRVSSAGSSCVLGDPPIFTPDGEPPEAVLVNFGVDGAKGGGNLVLPCEVMGSPTPTVSWFRKGVEIASNVENGTLSIRVSETTASSDGTIYYCEATNMIGPGNSTTSTLRSRNVTVRSAYFQTKEENVSTIVGGSVSLECAFSGDLLASNVRWFADSNMITASENIQFLEGGRYLYIPMLSETQRGMRYRCEVSDFLDENRIPIRAPTTYTLNTNISEGSIVVYKNQSTVSGRVNETVQLVFVAAGRDNIARVTPALQCREPTPFVTYGTLAGTTIPVTLTAAASNVDQVQFTCQVFAALLPTQDVVGTIIVSGPISSEYPANITSSFADPDRNRSVGGGPVEYSCVASGSPAPTITWYYNGALVQSGSGGVVVGGDGTLTISAPQVSHSGIYQCFARNQFGEDSRTWILEVADPVIGMVILNSISKIVRKPQGNLLYAPSGTANMTITTTLQSTTIRDINTCGSFPEPQWKINDTDVMSDDPRYIFSSSSSSPTGPYTFTLTIKNLTAETSGNYSVTVTLANFGISRESPELFVTSLCISRIIGISGAEERVDIGNDLELHCMFFEIVSMSISWFKDGAILSNRDQFDISPVINGVSTLRISSMAVKDSDVYTCITTSEECGSDSRSVTIEVQHSGSGGSESIGDLVGGIVAAIVSVLVVEAVW